MHKNCLCSEGKLKTSQKSYLRQIGLSKDAVRLYDILLAVGPMSAQEASFHTETFASANYRLFYELEGRQLVIRESGWPRLFKALPIGDGLQASLIKKEKELEALVNKTIANDDTASIIIGRQQVYDAYNNYACKAKSQICVYAIGIAYNKELAKTQKAAVKRGVAIRHVVQEVKQANFYVIDSWLKLGVDLRTLKRSRGYHLMTFDDRCAIVTFSNPEDTDQRVSLVTTNQGVINIFQAQFESIWNHAKPVA